MPSLRPYFAATGFVAGSVLGATGAAFLVDRLGGGSGFPLAPVAAVLVVVALFWYRPPEGLVAFAVFTLLADTVEHWLGLDLLLFDELSVLLLAAVGVVRHGAPNGRLRIGVPEVALMVLALAGIVSSMVAGVPIFTLLAGLALLFKAIGLFYVVSWLRLSIDDASRMGFVVVVTGLVIGALGFVEWLNPTAFQSALGLPPFEQSRASGAVIRSIFLHPAQYGWVTAFTSLLLYAVFLTRRWWWALPVAIALNVGTVMSGRRTPLLGVGAGIGSGLLRQLSSPRISRTWLLRTLLPLAGALILFLVWLLPVFAGLYRHTINEYLPSPVAVAELFSEEPDAEIVASLHPRTALYLGSVAVARDHLPLGAGFGRYGSHLSRADYSPVYAEYGLDRINLLGPERPDAVTDTFWPMVLGETGIFGLLAALTFFGSLLADLWRTAGAGSSPAMRAIALGVLMVFVEGLVRSLTASVYTAPPIAYYVMGAAGVGIAVRRTLAEDATPTAPTGTA